MRHISKKALFVLCLPFSFLIMNYVLTSVSVKALTSGQDNSAVSTLRRNAYTTQDSIFQSEVTHDLAFKFISRHSIDNRLDSGIQTEASQKEVRVVYLVPSDKVIRPDYEAAIRTAIVHLQAFYQSQLGSGNTFSLHSPIIEVYQTSHASAFYSSGQNASDIGFWSSVLGDGFALSGGGFDDPNNRWIYYVDADPACGQVVGGTNGVALLPANDLRGLTGQPNVPPCPNQSPDMGGLCRWVGGLGHELGHAFGLPHPPGCDQGSCSEFASRSLMYLGYITYPNTYLLQEDKDKLLATGFFSIHDNLEFSPDCTGVALLNDTAGLYDPTTAQFFLRNLNSAGSADLSFVYGPAGAGWIPLAGDWDGDGVVTAGLLNPSTSQFFLKNTNAGGAADIVFAYGPAGAGWAALAGDWDGDGVDTVGLYNPSTSQFFLKNTNAAGSADIVFAYGPAGAGWIPIVGDWDGDGTDSIGLFNPATNTFFLNNTNAGGAADLVFSYGPAGAGWIPLAGDWDGDGVDTVGLLNPATSQFFLKNTNAAGASDLVFSYGPAGAGWTAIVGSWDGT